MKTTTKSKRRIPVLLSILCAGLVATFLGGCAESPYVTKRLLSDRILRDTHYKCIPVFLLRAGLRYYGRALGVRYNDAYGPRYYRTRTVYGDW